MPRIKPRYKEPTDLSGLIAREINPPLGDISVQRLIDDGLIVLYREIKNLLAYSTKGKLDPNSAKDLRDHLKLLFELKDREAASLRNLTDEQMKAMAVTALKEETLNDDKQDGTSSGSNQP